MSLLKNAKRHTTIIEMKDWEKGYINEKSLAFSINKTTQEVIYLLFHFDKYSSTKHISDYNEIETFDVEITCSKENWIKNFFVINNRCHIDHVCLNNIDKDIYTVLDYNNEKIDTFDAMQNNLELDELYDSFQNFIENLLEQDDEDSWNNSDEKYFSSWSNFSDAIIDLCDKDNRGEIENILCNMAIMASNDTNQNQILDNLSEQKKCTDYLVSLSKEKMQWHIEQDTLEEISLISSFFYEIFIKTWKKDTQEKTIESKIKELKSDLDKAVEEDDFDKAAMIRDQLIALWVNPT